MRSFGHAGWPSSEAAWDLQDRVEAGQARPADYQVAFAQARAAAAIAFAIERTDAAALDALYEAYHAIDDHDLFLHEVEAVLRR